MSAFYHKMIFLQFSSTSVSQINKSYCLKVALYFPCTVFKACIGVWVPLNFVVAETRVGVSGGRTFTITLALGICFAQNVSFSVDLYI